MAGIYLHQDGRQTGPFPPEQVRQMKADGQISETTPAWREGLAEWTTVGRILANPPKIAVVPRRIFPPVPNAIAPQRGMSRGLLITLLACGVGIIVLSLVAGMTVLGLGWMAAKSPGPADPDPSVMAHVQYIAKTDAIAQMMAAYAHDHGGVYPTGKTSTEVFQLLLDSGYGSDPEAFYVEMPGKTKPTSHTLTADNVCFDVTGGITAKSSGRVPVAFSTGYLVDYSPGARVEAASNFSTPLNGIAVTYKNTVGGFFPYPWPDGEMDPFIEKDFDSRNFTYTQLRP